LWDPNYKESSWIANDAVHEPIRLLPRLKEKIAKNYPGTKLSITEYNYGGGDQISGALAEADVLGIFGREGVFAAALWPLAKDERFIYSGFAMYRNFDGKDGRFGDLSIAAQTDSAEKSSVYAAIDRAHPDRMAIVALNKTNAPLMADCAIVSKTPFKTARLYRLTGASATPRADGEQAVGAGARLRISLPPMSVTTLILQP
jgi:O-glycosyl hydrolase